MIIFLSAAIALVSLVVGIVLGQPIFSYVALGLCVVAIAVLAADLMKTRRRTQSVSVGGADDNGSPAVGGASGDSDDRCDDPSDTFMRGDSSGEMMGSEASEEMEVVTAEPDDDLESSDRARVGRDNVLVHVIPGRKRYHLGECPLIAGKDSDRIGAVEAREEGLSPCGVCQPERVPAV